MIHESGRRVSHALLSIIVFVHSVSSKRKSKIIGGFKYIKSKDCILDLLEKHSTHKAGLPS